MIETTINTGGKLLSLSKPLVMAIVNATTDSFAYRCRNISEAEILRVTAKAIQEGADIIDVGGCSTRPGSMPVSAEEEWRRLDIALRAIRRTYPKAIISADTFRADIARKAVEIYGVDIINDVSGGGDPEMFRTVAELGVPYILTHNCDLKEGDIVVQVLDFFVRKSDELHRLGVKDVIVDPGFGFKKTEAQNYELLHRLADLKHVQLPILVGLSRKSMFYKPLQTTPDSNLSLEATTKAHLEALQAGANILRVHDVAEARKVVQNTEYRI